MTVMRMRELRRDGWSLSEIAKLYGCHHSTIHYYVGPWMRPATMPQYLVHRGAGL